MSPPGARDPVGPYQAHDPVVPAPVGRWVRGDHPPRAIGSAGKAKSIINNRKSSRDRSGSGWLDSIFVRVAVTYNGRSASLGDPPSRLRLELLRFRLEGIDTGWKVVSARRVLPGEVEKAAKPAVPPVAPATKSQGASPGDSVRSPGETSG
jgi:hypothetical protein